MELYFLRHGLAEDPSPGMADSERALVPEGVKKMKKAAEGMERMGVRVDAVISSPYERAKQTAQIALEGLGMKGAPRYSDALVPHGSPKDLKKLLAEYPQDARLLLVGHLPSISLFVSEIVSGKAAEWLDVKKGGLCYVELYPGEFTGKFKWLLTCRQLRAHAGS